MSPNLDNNNNYLIIINIIQNPIICSYTPGILYISASDQWLRMTYAGTWMQRYILKNIF